MSAKQHLVTWKAVSDQQDLMSKPNKHKCLLTWTCKQSVSAME